MIGLLTILVTRDADDPLLPEGPPSNVLEQIEQSEIWVEPPTIFDSADDRLSFPGDTAWSVAAVEFGDVVALTPEELVDEAVRYEGAPIYVVGRVEDLRSIPDDFGVEQELQLRTAGDSRAYVGSSDVIALEGDVVFALGRVAALGQVELPSGAKANAVYFLAVNPSSGVDFDTWNLELVQNRFGVAPSIRDAAKRATRD